MGVKNSDINLEIIINRQEHFTYKGAKHLYHSLKENTKC